MKPHISPEILRALRNQVNIDDLISLVLLIPCKHSEGYLRFLCPACHEFRTATNPKTNLARCFLCQRNFNTIDITMASVPCSFIEAVSFLRPLLF